MEGTMLRLLWQELVYRRNAIIGWSLGLCFFPLVYIGIYPSVAEEMVGLADLEIYQAMGINLGTFADWIGSILVLFMPLVASIYAIVNGTGTLAAEEEDGRLEMVVALPLPRWQIVTAKALALIISTLIIFLVVSVCSFFVFQAIEGQLETDMVGLDLATAVFSAWPLVFAFGMIGMFLASICPSRRVAAMIATAIMIVSYFGDNLANSTTALEPLEPCFLFSYLDSTGQAVREGQQTGDVLVLIGVGLVAFALALLFFQRRDLTVGAWPWQRLQARRRAQT
jgi:ABC-2 type transport system permease protein